MLLHARGTSGLPLIAFFHGEMGAISRKRPTIMESPDQFLLFLPEIPKQHFKVAVVTVNIVQMHDIRLNALQLCDHVPGGLFGMETIVAEKFRFQCLKPDISRLGTGNTQGIPIAAAAENIIFDARGRHDPADTNAYFSRAADAAGGIDLDNFHQRFSQKNEYGYKLRVSPPEYAVKK